MDLLRRLGVGALALASLALVGGCGGGGNSAPSPIQPTPTPPPTTLPSATLADLSASLTSPQKDAKLNCRQQVKVQVKLTNRAAGRVIVEWVEKESKTLSGGCGAAPTYNYTPEVGTVQGGTTATVMNGNLYTGGSGCCIGDNSCSGSCVFEETLTVLTRLGRVPAGKFTYRVTFGNCTQCDRLGATAPACAASARL